MTYTLSPALRLVLSQLESAATARAEAYNGVTGDELVTIESRTADRSAHPTRLAVARHGRMRP